MREYVHSDAPGLPTVVVVESCDDPGCDRLYVLPDGELGFPELPPMPLIADMGERMKQDGWANDPLLSKWLCPETIAAAKAAAEGTPHVARQAITDTAQWSPEDVARAVAEADAAESVPPAEDEELYDLGMACAHCPARVHEYATDQWTHANGFVDCFPDAVVSTEAEPVPPADPEATDPDETEQGEQS